MDPRLKSLEREARRSHILDAAEGCFAEAGFDGTPMDAVARASGFTKRTVYGYFASKEELWCGVMARALHGLGERFEAVTAPDGCAAIMAMGQAFERFVQEEPRRFQVLAEGRTQAGNLAEDTRGLQELGAAQARMQGAMAEAIRRGVLDGSLRADLDPEETAALLAIYSTAIMSTVCREARRACIAYEPGGLMARSLAFLGHALRAPG